MNTPLYQQFTLVRSLLDAMLQRKALNTQHHIINLLPSRAMRTRASSSRFPRSISSRGARLLSSGRFFPSGGSQTMLRQALISPFIVDLTWDGCQGQFPMLILYDFALYPVKITSPALRQKRRFPFENEAKSYPHACQWMT